MSSLDFRGELVNAGVIATGDGDAHSVHTTSKRGEVLGVLSGVLEEIEQSAVLIAVSASIAASLAEGSETAIVAIDLQAYLPPEPRVYQAVASDLGSFDLNHSILLPLHAYHHRFSYARRMSRAIVAAGPAPSEQIRADELERLSLAWQHTCGTALAAMSALRSALTRAGVAVTSAASANAEDLLHAAHMGECPCVSEGGTITVPGWAENRRAQRYPLRISTRLFMAGKKHSAMIDNISETGVGLSNIRGIEKGAAVTVELPRAEAVTGTVMWSGNGRVGVKFDKRLSPEHPLLIGLSG